MVRLHVKKGDESQFLYETHVDAMVEDVLYEVTIIYNGRLKILRICYEKENRIEYKSVTTHCTFKLHDVNLQQRCSRQITFLHRCSLTCISKSPTKNINARNPLTIISEASPAVCNKPHVIRSRVSTL
ncbi:cilia- and flagella-associated protein 298 isoform X1 [Vespula squamosa]|uniref:Cilia- and flagella-associated protein 298 isoform X1 n=1 Tax=Vespula squamosa TaxID=30214 RepID=A0ABD2B365_VESSQ